MAKRAVTPESPRVDGLTVALAAFASLGLVSLFGAASQNQAMDEAAIVFGIVGLIAAAGLLVRERAVVPRTRLGLAWAAFLAWALLAVAGSGRVWSALVGEPGNLLGWLTLVTLTLVVVGVATRGTAARRALAALAPIVLFGEVAATLVQLAMGAAQARGSLPNSTYLGEALVLLLPFALAQDSGFIELSRSARRGLVVATVVALAASGARVAAVVALAWALWTLLRASSLERRMKVVATVALIAVVGVAGFTFARGEILGSTGVETLGERPQMWRAALLATAQRPLLGYGPDGYIAGGASVTTPQLARAGTVMDFREGAIDPHSLPVWVAVSTGFVGLVLFLWAAVELALAWRARARAGEDIAPYAWAIAGTVLVFCTAPAALQVLPLFGLVLGASLARPDLPAEDDVAGPSLTRITGLALVIVLGAGAATYLANTATRLPLETHGEKLSPGKVSTAEVAMNVWGLDSHLAHLASLHWGWVAAGNQRVAASEYDLAAIERAYRLDSRDPFIALERARSKRFYGRPVAEVSAAFEDAIRRYPLFPLARAEYAVVLADTGRVHDAEAQLAIAELIPVTRSELRDALAAARDAITRAK